MRCHRYWPDGTDMYGQTQVVLLTENEYSGYIQREFKLIDTKVGGCGSWGAWACVHVCCIQCVGIGGDSLQLACVMCALHSSCILLIHVHV